MLVLEKTRKAEAVVVLGSPINAESCANNSMVHTPSPKQEVIDLMAEEDYATFLLTIQQLVPHAIYHLSRAKLWFPPKHGSWACGTCDRNDWFLVFGTITA